LIFNWKPGFSVLVLFQNDNEGRLAALRGYAILDSPREEEFDQLVLLVREVFDMPMAAISFVDRDRQWFKAEAGLGCEETPLSCSVCALAVESGLDVLIIPDAIKDLRTSANPMVAGGPQIRFYAGAVLRTPTGHALGSLHLLDTKPRDLTNTEVRLLSTLSRQVMLMLEARRVSQDRLAMNERLLREVEMRKEMLGVVSHDLRQPLGTIHLVAHLSEEWNGTDAQGRRIGELGALLRSSAEDMQRLVTDLSDYSMMEQGQLVMRFQEMPVARLAEEIRLRYNLVARNAGMELRVVEGADLPVSMQADPYRLLQAIGNLVGNALHHSPPNGTLEVRFVAMGGGLAIEVSDRGKGISTEALGMIFEKFWTSGGSTGGRGIGLAVARNIVRAHGGELTVASEPGVLTTFRLELPSGRG
jgi:signal transduction histidine kinase